MIVRRLYFVFLFLTTVPAQARVFDINRDSVAPYFMGTGAGVQVATSSLDGEGVDGVTFTGTVNYLYTGEIGVLYSRSAASLRFGFEILKPNVLESTAQSGATELYTVNSVLIGYVPKVIFELNLQKTQKFRSFLALGAGLASMNMKNSYTLTADGQAIYPGVADHIADSKADTTLISAALGYEGLLSDTTTILVEFGYRQLKFDNFKYTKEVTTLSGAKVSGDKLLTNSGLDRVLNFSGGFASLGFRFYF